MHFSDLDVLAVEISRALFGITQVKHVQNMVVVVHKHDVTRINHAILAAGQLGQLIDT